MTASGPEQRPYPISAFFDLRHDAHGYPYFETWCRGIAVLRFVLLNKGSAFSVPERRQLGVDGLLPSRVSTLEEQLERAWVQLQTEPTALGRYQFLRGLQERQETLFYALVARHLEALMPIVYTPTVGEAVEKFSTLFQTPRGLTVHEDNLDDLDAILDHYPLYDVRVMVVTDSSAILGIGDQGFNGMGISIGKLTLYTVGGGVAPYHTMPVVLDVGTDHASYRTDPLYLGRPSERLKGPAYDAFLERFVRAVHKRWPEAILQWEDLSKDAAFDVLERYRHQVPCLNDDIQGTGAVTLAGVISACHRKGERLSDQVFAIHGAGAGGIGVASAIREGLLREGLTEAEAYARIYVLDSRGLMLSGRELPAYKRPFARDPDDVVSWVFEGPAPNLVETVAQAGVTVLLGLSGQPGSFDRSVIEAVAANTARPIVFPLSNPTRLAEALPSEVLAWTDGRALVATGSPFEPVELDGTTYVIGQGNNAFVFPGLGLGAMLARVTAITDGMVLAAAYAVADHTEAHHAHDGLIYPPLRELPTVSRRVAHAVLRAAEADGVSREALPADAEALDAWIDARWWTPSYVPIVWKDRGPYPRHRADDTHEEGR
ncbi:MAG: NAD-dependent malic enzyme [Alphaproteobacteria bacterium]|nr:NAD-dependent malic enzyme [Alphaproteobacteria bacterium]